MVQSSAPRARARGNRIGKRRVHKSKPTGLVSYVKSLLPAIFADNKDETDTNDEEDDEDEVAKVVPSVEAASSAKVGSSEFQPSAAVSSSSNEASAAGAVTGDDATSTLESTQDGRAMATPEGPQSNGSDVAGPSPKMSPFRGTPGALGSTISFSVSGHDTNTSKLFSSMPRPSRNGEWIMATSTPQGMGVSSVIGRGVRTSGSTVRRVGSISRERQRASGRHHVGYQSPFHRGVVGYGGRSAVPPRVSLQESAPEPAARKRLRDTDTSPVHSRAQSTSTTPTWQRPTKRRVVPQTAVPAADDTSSLASDTAKRILDTIKKVSSPLSDASRLASFEPSRAAGIYDSRKYSLSPSKSRSIIPKTGLSQSASRRPDVFRYKPSLGSTEVFKSTPELARLVSPDTPVQKEIDSAKTRKSSIATLSPTGAPSATSSTTPEQDKSASRTDVGGATIQPFSFGKSITPSAALEQETETSKPENGNDGTPTFSFEKSKVAFANKDVTANADSLFSSKTSGTTRPPMRTSSLATSVFSGDSGSDSTGTTMDGRKQKFSYGAKSSTFAPTVLSPPSTVSEAKTIADNKADETVSATRIFAAKTAMSTASTSSVSHAAKRPPALSKSVHSPTPNASSSQYQFSPATPLKIDSPVSTPSAGAFTFAKAVKVTEQASAVNTDSSPSKTSSSPSASGSAVSTAVSLPFATKASTAAQGSNTPSGGFKLSNFGKAPSPQADSGTPGSKETTEDSGSSIGKSLQPFSFGTTVAAGKQEETSPSDGIDNAAAVGGFGFARPTAVGAAAVEGDSDDTVKASTNNTGGFKFGGGIPPAASSSFSPFSTASGSLGLSNASGDADATKATDAKPLATASSGFSFKLATKVSSTDVDDSSAASADGATTTDDAKSSFSLGDSTDIPSRGTPFLTIAESSDVDADAASGTAVAPAPKLTFGGSTDTTQSVASFKFGGSDQPSPTTAKSSFAFGAGAAAATGTEKSPFESTDAPSSTTKSTMAASTALSGAPVPGEGSEVKFSFGQMPRSTFGAAVTPTSSSTPETSTSTAASSPFQFGSASTHTATQSTASADSSKTYLPSTSSAFSSGDGATEASAASTSAAASTGGFNFGGTGGASSAAPTSAAASTGGFNFGGTGGAVSASSAAPISASTPTGSFNFGGTGGASSAAPTSASTSTGGFNFGGTGGASIAAPTSASTPTGGFNFGGTGGASSAAPTPAGASTGGFNFGSVTTSSSTTPSGGASTGSFNFGGTGGASSAAPTSAAASAGFSFGGASAASSAAPTSASTPTGGFNFGGTGGASSAAPTSASTSTGGFNFGGTGGASIAAPTSASTSTGGFNFGSVTTSSSTTPSGGASTGSFNFGSGSHAPSNGFNFGSSSTPSTVPNAGPAAGASTGGFNFGGGATSGVGIPGGAPAFNFGNAPTAAGGANFGGANTAVSGASTGFNYGAGGVASATPAFNFSGSGSVASASGGASGFNFGAGAPASPVPTGGVVGGFGGGGMGGMMAPAGMEQYGGGAIPAGRVIKKATRSKRRAR